MPSDLAALWGPAGAGNRPPRVLGLFAHPDDEVFCVGGTIARCAAAGATTAIVSLTRGEAGQIRDATAATRRTLGAVRAAELARAGDALGVDHVTCLDLGDGRLGKQPLTEVAATARAVIASFRPDVVVTFGPDGATGHPDHAMSCLATAEAIRTTADPPRLLHARFPVQEQLLLDVLVAWLTSHDERFTGTAEFGHALKLIADGCSMLGVAADHFDVEWFPAGSSIIEQGEFGTELFCILSGSADILAEGADGHVHDLATVGPGCFVGEDEIATRCPRKAHVVAREDVTCLVLSPGRADPSAGRDAGGAGTEPAGTERFAVDVHAALDHKVAALAAHRTQYALGADLLPRTLLESLFATEHFTVAQPAHAAPAEESHEHAVL
ncbi:PIG-L family deacetylase [Pseudonocardia sp. MH-G8]|uniref:PIG-L family deacetylase n=1 Tax=Pseudonocardia sp. MH-G8 TaxID=1854588 RepID=UPI0013043CF9|nr:PIG-L family deacetylase [Pseudonocardia sp. MH-G8]